MTDNEIIKALECCGDTSGSECSECPLISVDCSPYDLYKLALDLINRQKAKIERLEKEKDSKLVMCIANDKEKIKSEAIKEFAEKLKNCFAISGDYLDIINIIDSLAKEMTEVNENDRA